MAKTKERLRLFKVKIIKKQNTKEGHKRIQSAFITNCT